MKKILLSIFFIVALISCTGINQQVYLDNSDMTVKGIVQHRIGQEKFYGSIYLKESNIAISTDSDQHSVILKDGQPVSGNVNDYVCYQDGVFTLQ